MGFLGSFLGKLFADELRAWLPWLQERAIQAAVRKLPSEQQERYNEEWRSHLNDVPGEIAKTWVAIGFLKAAKEISSRRKFAFSRIGALALYLFLLPVISLVYAVTILTTRNRYVFPLSNGFGNFIINSRHIPIGFILHYSLYPNIPVRRLYWENNHYSSWRPSLLVMLEDFFMARGLIHLLSLHQVVMGRLSSRRWFEVLVANSQTNSKVLLAGNPYTDQTNQLWLSQNSRE